MEGGRPGASHRRLGLGQGLGPLLALLRRHHWLRSLLLLLLLL
jgi:hypothetical protein